jgi:hypothetical protein
MQSSVRSMTPRLVDIGKTGSDPSVHVEKEVTTISSRKDSYKERGRRATYSAMPSLFNRHVGQSSQGATDTILAPQLSRWNSDSRMSSTSWASSRKLPQRKLRRQSLIDEDSLESNRESMKALAEFLRTKVCLELYSFSNPY